jgi:c-di-GMP-binding flagellar brake protein YcgR
MKLTPQHLAEVVSAMTAAPASTAGLEKRRAARMDVQGTVVIAPLNVDGSMGKPFTAVTRNISFVGVGLLQSKPLIEGQQVIIRLPRAGSTKQPMLVRCTVMHVRPLAEGLYVVGLEFIEVSDVKEEQLMGKPADAATTRGRQSSFS